LGQSTSQINLFAVIELPKVRATLAGGIHRATVFRKCRIVTPGTFMAVACTNGEELLPALQADLKLTRSTGIESESIKLPWFALQVRARYEQGVADHLDGKGYELFLPVYKCRKRWSDRVKEVEAPLFPGYLFCRLNPQDRLPILKTPGVIQVVGTNRTPTAVDENEIQAIQAMVASGIPNQPWPFLTTGDRVRIESGPLSGLEGILVEFKGNHRLVLSVSLLQRSVAVEIDSAFVASLRSTSGPRLEKAASHGRAVSLAV
jgi:transcription antitermination factor NusG